LLTSSRPKTCSRKGAGVFHSHFHVIPRYEDEPLAGKGVRYWLKQPENKREKQFMVFKIFSVKIQLFEEGLFEYVSPKFYCGVYFAVVHSSSFSLLDDKN
jgi:hypothetical protein